MKKTLLTTLYICLFGQSLFASIQNDILVDIGIDGSESDAQNINELTVFESVRNILFAFLGVTAIGVILWIAISFLGNKGKEDEFKKSTLSLIYLLIGLALIPTAYFIVSTLLNLNF